MVSSLPTSPESGNQDRPHPPRESSLGFIRRMKSVERVTTRRSSSGGKLSKKQEVMERQQQEREAAAIPQLPPRIPDLPSPGKLQTFGGEDASPPETRQQTTRAPETRQQITIPGRPGQFVSSRSVPHQPIDTDGTHNVPIPPIPGRSSTGLGEHTDPYTRTESMTHRGRFSYANSTISTVNSPRRVRRRKDPTPFNILVVGARNSGKTSFLNFLRTSLALPKPKHQSQARDEHIEMLQASLSSPSPNFDSQYLETEINGERIGLTLWDSQGLEQNVADLQLREISAFLESKFEDTFTEEMKVVRATGVQDTHIHCVFLILDPVRLDTNLAAAQEASATNGAYSNGKSHSRASGPLDEDLDLQVLRTLQGKTTVVPVISKADTVTVTHMAHLKRVVWDSLKRANLDPLEALGIGDTDDTLDERDENSAPDRSDSPITHLEDPSDSDNDDSTVRSPGNGVARSRPTSTLSPDETPTFPLSILSPDPSTPFIVGRKFAWGFADPYNAEHCDFVKLKEAIFKEWRGDLREASRELWYEGWRTERLNGKRTRVVEGGNGGKGQIGRAIPYRSKAYSLGRAGNDRGELSQ